MDHSSERTQDEARIMQRQLYRAGETPPVSKGPAPTTASTLANPPSVPAGVPARSVGTRWVTAASDKSSRGRRILLMLLLLGVGYYLLYGSPTQRKRALMALGVAAFLLILGGIYCYLYLPDLEAMSHNLRAIREDPNLTPEQKFEKSREIFSKLTPGQGRQVFQNDLKKLHHERNAEMQKFLKMSREEQAAYVKKQAEERIQLRPKDGFAVGAAPRGGGSGTVVKGGGAGGGFVFYGPPGGGGPGGKPANPSQMQKTMLDDLSPETRAGRYYQRGLSR